MKPLTRLDAVPHVSFEGCMMSSQGRPTTIANALRPHDPAT